MKNQTKNIFSVFTYLHNDTVELKGIFSLETISLRITVISYNDKKLQRSCSHFLCEIILFIILFILSCC